jgi:hypothetical protein
VASTGVGLRAGVEGAARVGVASTVADAPGGGGVSAESVQAARRRVAARNVARGRWRGIGVQSVSAPANGTRRRVERFRCDA